MKVLVISDSHGFTRNVIAALEKEPEINTVFFLGDGLSDIDSCKEKYPEKQFVCVRGNNDLFFDTDVTAYKYIDGNTVVLTHGHKYAVRETLFELFKHAESVRANVVLYGHTHKSCNYYDPYFKIYAINPGAMCDGRYAVVSFEKSGVEAQLKSIF